MTSVYKTIEEEKRYVRLLHDWANQAFDKCERALSRSLREATAEMNNISWLVTELYESGLRLKSLQEQVKREQIKGVWSGFSK